MLLYDDVFWQALKNTLIFIGASPIAIALALGIALLVNSDLKGAAVYRTIVFLSYPLMTVAVGIIWRWMYDERGGIINFALRESGLVDQADPVPAELRVGAAVGHRRRGLAGARLLHDHPAHRAAEHPAAPLRGRLHRRRAALGAVLAHHAADAEARRCSSAPWSASSTRSPASTSSTS